MTKWIPIRPIFTWDELVSGANWQWGELTENPFKYTQYGRSVRLQRQLQLNIRSFTKSFRETSHLGKWPPGNRLSGKRPIRENDYPGNDFPGNVFPGKKPSGKRPYTKQNVVTEGRWTDQQSACDDGRCPVDRRPTVQTIPPRHHNTSSAVGLGLSSRYSLLTVHKYTVIFYDKNSQTTCDIAYYSQGH